MKIFLVLFAVILNLHCLGAESPSFIPDNDNAVFPVRPNPEHFLNAFLIFTNGSIYKNADEKLENLLVIDGVVMGHNVDVNDYPLAEIIDLKGKAAYPGFNDSHVHLMETSPFVVMGINMAHCTNSQDIADSLTANLHKVKEGDLMIGVGFSLPDYDAWNSDDLEKINSAAGNRLVFIGDKLGHNAIVNSLVLDYCGITNTTKEPMGGIIGKKNGVLTGMLRESAMTLAGNKLFSLLDKDLIKTTSLQMFRYWASIGYSGIVDLMGAAAGRILYPEIAVEMEKEGTLPIRIHYCYTFFKVSEIDSAVKYKTISTDKVRFLGCKLFIDGAYAAGQAWTSWLNERNNNGLYYVYPNDSCGAEYNLNTMVKKLEENGLSCHYHIQGDQGIENLLNALDSVVSKQGKLNCLHTIIHSAFITEQQINRIKAFNGKVVMTMQPGFWEVEDDLEYYYGHHFYDSYPVKNIIDSGITVGMSTDFTVSPLLYSPAAKVIQVAVSGGGKPDYHRPLTMRDMIHGFSFASNVTTGCNDLGLLEVGYKADIIVYDKDFYTLSLEDINHSLPKVKAVWVGGIKTFEVPDTISTINEFQNHTTMIYPNPITDMASIVWENFSEGRVKITITDVLGTLEETVYEGTAILGKQKLSFNTNNLYGGMYIINISNEQFHQQKKVIIVK